MRRGRNEWLWRHTSCCGAKSSSGLEGKQANKQANKQARRNATKKLDLYLGALLEVIPAKVVELRGDCSSCHFGLFVGYVVLCAGGECHAREKLGACEVQRGEQGECGCSGGGAMRLGTRR